MEVIKLVGFVFISLFLIIIIKEQKKDIALVLVILSGALILSFTVFKLNDVVTLIDSFIESSGINKEVFKIVLKVIGISYIIDFAKNVCEDAGQKALSSKLEIAGKVIILTISIPIFSLLLSVIQNII